MFLTTAVARSAPREAQLRIKVRTPNTIILEKEVGGGMGEGHVVRDVTPPWGLNNH